MLLGWGMGGCCLMDNTGVQHDCMFRSSADLGVQFWSQSSNCKGVEPVSSLTCPCCNNSFGVTPWQPACWIHWVPAQWKRCRTCARQLPVAKSDKDVGQDGCDKSFSYLKRIHLWTVTADDLEEAALQSVVTPQRASCAVILHMPDIISRLKLTFKLIRSIYLVTMVKLPCR